MVITPLSVVEASSAFRRKYNRDEIERGRVEDLLAAFFTEALEEFLLVMATEQGDSVFEVYRDRIDRSLSRLFRVYGVPRSSGSSSD